MGIMGRTIAEKGRSEKRIRRYAPVAVAQGILVYIIRMVPLETLTSRVITIAP